MIKYLIGGKEIFEDTKEGNQKLSVEKQTK